MTIITGSRALAELLVHDCLQVLAREYPNHPWRVGMSEDQSMVYILHSDISDQYGYRLKTTRVQMDPSRKCVVTGAGELLERAAMIRGKMKELPTHIDLRHATKDIRMNDKVNKIKKVVSR